MMNLITWSDGTLSLIDIAEKCNEPVWNLIPILKNLVGHNLLEIDNNGG